MCTVTYIPTGTNSYILTSNRDEQPSRSAKKLVQRESGENILVFPQDAKAGGTWIAISNNNRMVCLLNGAFVKHKHNPPYRRSRGLMVLDFFDYERPTDFFTDYPFEGMEPFTMILYADEVLWEIRWDGHTLHQKELDPQQTHLWSSATLYTAEVAQKRERWFAEWQQRTKTYTQEHILDFHYHAGEGDPENDVIMNRNGKVRTVSITSIEKGEGGLTMLYLDLLNGNQDRDEIKLLHKQNP